MKQRLSKVLHSPRHKIIVIVGPTATGKSALAVTLARRFGGEVISADSRQVYRGLDIGSGKIKKSERYGVRHHLLDVVSPRLTFTAERFRRLGEAALRDIVKRGKTPIVCGGTGFYIEALLSGLTLPSVPPLMKLRRRLNMLTTEELFGLLIELDSKRAATIDPYNRVRLIRAIEIAQTLGRVPPRARQRLPYKLLWIGLDLPDADLKQSTRERLRERLRRGLIAEVKRLRKEGVSWKRLHDLGLEYRFVASYLRGGLSREEMEEKLLRAIWHFAKRQRRWFRREREIRWFEPPEIRGIERVVRKFLTT